MVTCRVCECVRGVYKGVCGRVRMCAGVRGCKGCRRLLVVESRLLLCPHHLSSNELLLLGHPSLCLQPHLLEGVEGGVVKGGKGVRGDGATGRRARRGSGRTYLLGLAPYCLLTTHLLTYSLTQLPTYSLTLTYLLRLTHRHNNLLTCY